MCCVSNIVHHHPTVHPFVLFGLPLPASLKHLSNARPLQAVLVVAVKVTLNEALGRGRGDYGNASGQSGLPQDCGPSEGPGTSMALGQATRPPTSTRIITPGYLEDKLERALLRTSGVSSAEVTRGAASARFSLSDAVSPSAFTSGSDSYTATKQRGKR